MIRKVQKFVYQPYILQRRRTIQKLLLYYYKVIINLISTIRLVENGKKNKFFYSNKLC